MEGRAVDAGAAPLQPGGDPFYIDLREVGAAASVCAQDGRVLACSPSGDRMLERFRIRAQIPVSLWTELMSGPPGLAAEWYTPGDVDHGALGCSRYPLGSRQLLVMSEVTSKNQERARLLHRQRLEAMGSLVTSVAHDLRAPLASIIYNIDVLATPGIELGSTDLQQISDDMSTSATRLRGTVERLLDFGRPGGAMTKEASVREVVSRVEALVRPRTRAGNHRVNCHVAESADTVQANALLVEQILLNLVLNALEASERDGLVVMISAERLTLPTLGDTVRITVSDSGPGIPPHLWERVFEPFFSTKAEGTGLGLTTARQAARELGGNIALCSGGAPGTTFALDLPATPLKASGEASP